MLELVTPPADTPVSLDEAKGHLRAIVPFVEDALITLLIGTATEEVQQFTGRQVCEATWDLYLDAFPTGWIDLPLPPLRSVESVTYTDTDGAEQSLADFQTDTVRGRIAPAYGEHWPATRDIPNAVRIRFVCGYTDVPAPLKSATLLLVGDLFENREAYGPVQLHKNTAVERLLWPFRVFR